MGNATVRKNGTTWREETMAIMRFLLLVVHQILLWLTNECMTWPGLEAERQNTQLKENRTGFLHIALLHRKPDENNI